MKEIKDKLLIEKYSDSISSYVHLDNVSLQMFEFEKGELMIQPSFHFHSIYFLVKEAQMFIQFKQMVDSL